MSDAVPTDRSRAGIARRRSPVDAELRALGATFSERHGGEVAMACGRDVAAEAAQARELGLVDVSLLPRLGFKGRDTAAWLARHGIAVGDAPNVAYRQADGALAARLAAGEVTIMSDIGERSTACRRLADATSLDDDVMCFPVPRGEGHFRFLVTGRQAAGMFAKICGVDLRPAKFPDLAIAQTSIARMSANVVRNDLGGTLAFDMHGDVASGAYMWMCLCDAMAEFGGRPVGLSAAQEIAGM
jgi:sarcosine oxidase subunit gamma